MPHSFKLPAGFSPLPVDYNSLYSQQEFAKEHPRSLDKGTSRGSLVFFIKYMLHHPMLGQVALFDENHVQKWMEEEKSKKEAKKAATMNGGSGHTPNNDASGEPMLADSDELEVANNNPNNFTVDNSHISPSDTPNDANNVASESPALPASGPADRPTVPQPLQPLQQRPPRNQGQSNSTSIYPPGFLSQPQLNPPAGNSPDIQSRRITRSLSQDSGNPSPPNKASRKDNPYPGAPVGRGNGRNGGRGTRGAPPSGAQGYHGTRPRGGQTRGPQYQNANAYPGNYQNYGIQN